MKKSISIDSRHSVAPTRLKGFVELLVFVMVIISSRAIVKLIIDGGAVNQARHLVVGGSESLLGYVLFGYLMLGWKLAVLLVVVLFGGGRRLRNNLDPVWVILIGLCFVSILWARYQQEARNSAFMILFSYVLVLLHFEICGWRRVISFITNVFLLVLFLSVFFVIVIPSYGISVGDHDGKWQGVFTHKNELGLFVSLAYVYLSMWFKFDKSWLVRIGIALSLILAVGSGSTSALFCVGISSFFIAILRYPWIRRRVYSWRYVLLAAMCGTCLYVFSISISQSSVIEIGNKDSSFSNRNLIWMFLLSQIYRAPWFGHGLEQIGASLMRDSSIFFKNVGFVVGTAHNGFIETAHALGFVGLFLVVAVLIRPLRQKKYETEFDFVFMFLTVFLIQNMFSSYLVGFNIYFIMLMYVSNILKYMNTGGDSINQQAIVSH